MKPERLITYCGVYGGCCARYIGYRAFREAARLLAEIADSHGFKYWMPGKVKEFDYAEFRKGLDFFGRDDTWLVCRECCSGGGVGPPDCVRDCCVEHGVDVCFDCDEYPCGRVEGDEAMLERGEEYHQLGQNEWLRRAEEKAVRGYEHHTSKYYQISIEQET
jgi:hypothetical protein